MGKKKKFDQNILYELTKEAKGIRMKKKAVQYACCHKDKKGNYRLKRVKGDNPYLYKCKICKDKRIDLSILNPYEKWDKNKEHPVSVKEKIKNAFRTLKSSADLIKLQTNGVKDEKVIEMVVDFEKKLYAYCKLTKKALKPNKKTKKFAKYNVNVTSGGKSLFNH